MRVLQTLFAAAVFTMIFQACGTERSSTPNAGTSASSTGDTAPVNPASTCNIPTDQRDSLMVSLPDVKGTYTVKIDADFSIDERSKIEKAIDTWNDLGLRKFRRILFRYELASYDAVSKSKIVDGCSTTASIEEGIFILKDTNAKHWSDLKLSMSNMAATLRCIENNKLTRQIVLVNTTLIDERQLASVVLHEIGHTIGLNHSCDDKADAASYIGCTAIATQPQHAYRVAAMYPTLRAASASAPNPAAAMPEIKETLQSNDELRSSCLLMPL